MNINRIHIVIALIVSVIVLSSCESSINTRWVDTQIEYCTRQAVKTLNNLPADSLPRNILSLQTKWNCVDYNDWTSGFWPGVLWNLFEATGDDKWKEEAIKYTSLLKPLAFGTPNDHDLGFQVFCSYGNQQKNLSDSLSKQVIIDTSNKLVKLFNPKVGTILSWPAMVKKMHWPHNTIIDNMMNLEMLFWAAKNGGDYSQYDIAFSHAEVSRKSLVRDNFSCFHVAVFDTIDGHLIKGVTHQGYNDNSVWARGQAWGIYGFTMCYRETNYLPFLATAQKMADVFIRNIPEGEIPKWDFNDPSIQAPKDASAACIAASALLELSQFSSDSKQEKYNTTAIQLLKKLSSEIYQSRNHNSSFLMHSTGHKPNNSEIDASIIYADYYYLEALLRLRKMLRLKSDVN
ncbi:glycoside hydrolase family 88 protein [Carboxylicivirga linearis]|uniref:Glycoside hydrolase family 88 protein n=1 Tax=Carboxylicivirga linearis TaxID=1628157 RepID=A0ABS5JV40_9BACT|nr:glycoside hydrolase family 88 protein [Carboxylicivirga linearis]MBS2098698.1 glycoside hydrolase family 88 protein [Carboxylicivirga linearis]